MYSWPARVAVIAAASASIVVGGGVRRAGAQSPRTTSSFHQLGRDILRELIETNTTASTGNTTPAVQRLAARFRAAGFAAADVQIVGPTARNRNLVVRYRGTGARKPLLLLAHLDVVEAKRDDWTVPPFTLTETGGYFYGRGTQDDKGPAATLVAALLRLRAERYVPDRDLILALTAGEEGGMSYNGVQWLIANKRSLINADVVINADAGGGELERGTPSLFDVQLAEKVYHSVAISVRNSGGHSSVPRADNAIYTMARALTRLSTFQFPVTPIPVVKAYFAALAPTADAATAADLRRVAAGTADSSVMKRLTATPLYNALLRTTCVATMVDGGHAENALPQSARATINCRLLPGSDPAAVERTLVRAIADTAVHLAPMDTAIASPASPLRADVMNAVSASVRAIWGAVPVVPTMETGATDGLYLRNGGWPVYGLSGIFIDSDDYRAHGQDERILISAFNGALDFTYDLLRRITSS
jgi:acetylornithine deacetylase/succinyl-diaminopimelate desuccinylase-like protein